MKVRLLKLKFPLLCFATFLLVFSLSYTFLGQGPGGGDEGGGNVGDEPGTGTNPTPGGPDNGTVGPVGQVNEIYQVIAKDDVDALKELLTGGADPNQTMTVGNTEGVTPLGWSVSGAKISTTVHSQVDVLLSHGANPSLQDGQGNTALHHAARAGDAGLATLLVKAGADPSLTNRIGYTAYQIALMSGNSGVAAAISQSALHQEPPNTETMIMVASFTNRLQARLDKATTDEGRQNAINVEVDRMVTAGKLTAELAAKMKPVLYSQVCESCMEAQ